MTHIELRGLIPAYALDALSPEEAREVEAHLPTCEECRRELVLMREVAGELAVAVQRVDPPPSLWTRILQAVGPRDWTVTIPESPAGRSAPVDPQGPTPPTAPRDRAAPRVLLPRVPRLGLPRNWMMGLAAAAALILVLTSLTVSLNRRLAAVNERLAAQERVLALMANPATRTAVLAGSVQANVRFVYHHGTQQGALIVTDLRDPGQELVYQLWLVAGQEPESVGVFKPVAGQPIVIPVRADFSRYQAIAISVERGPQGASRPSGAPILLASL